MTRGWFAAGLVPLAAAFLLTGCGSGETYVEGTAAIKGTKLNRGTLTFQGSEGPKSTPIGPDGSFKLVAPPTGQVTVTVEGPPEVKTPTAKGAPTTVMAPPGQKGEKPAPPSVIDPKYKDKANGETITINQGANRINLDFTK
jgi:hypothetical protein